VGENGSDFTKLHDFTLATSNGVNPTTDLVAVAGHLYGGAAGGSLNKGMLFRMAQDGSTFAKLHDFNFTDGATPRSLVHSDGFFYGTTAEGGAFDKGVVFRINLDGSGFTKLHDFNGARGSAPAGQLLVADGVLYGVTERGGKSGRGVVFALAADGSRFTALRLFTGADGAHPSATLALADGHLYGVTRSGGRAQKGVAFRMKTDGSRYAKLHDFTGPEGQAPIGGLLIAGNLIYGTTSQGGATNGGTIFRMRRDGSGFTKVRDLGHEGGAIPLGLLVAGSDDALYGSTNGGGPDGGGVVFRYVPDADLDGVSDLADNCRFMANADQVDADHDGQGDRCDVPALSVSNATSVQEGSAGSTNATFTISLGWAYGLPVIVTVQTANGTAQGGSDYVAKGPLELTFAPGQTQKSFPVAVKGDAANESNETFYLALSQPVGARIARARGVAVILDDEN
jgi:uncharacterized repeat protein (TIGR03803 family)